jgi:hypothetical protein
MLYVSLFLSFILLLITNSAARRSDHPILFTALGGVGLTLCPLLMGFFSVVVALHAILLVIAVTVWRLRCWRPGSFLVLSTVATVVAYDITAWFAFQDLTCLREQYPYVSMEDRLTAKAPARAGLMTAEMDFRLRLLEEAIESGDVHVSDLSQVFLNV